MTENSAPTTTTTTTVWSVGCGHDGRLGHGNESNLSRFKRIAKVDTDKVGRPLRIAVGGFHTFIICERGVLGFGCNDDGQLGLGDRTSRKVPTIIDFFGDASSLVTLVCGAYHSVALLNDGCLYSTGKNDRGQLGLGDTDSRNRFTKITSIDTARVMSVSCGSYHTLAMVSPTDNVQVAMACGKGDFGELGYDADAWDIAATREASIKEQVIARAHTEALAGGGGAGRPPGERVQPRFKVKSASQVKRRDAFYRTTLSIIRLPADIVPPSYFANNADTVAALVSAANDGIPTLPVAVHGMHHHSMLRGRDGALWTFGCYFCNQVEDITSSIPRRVELTPPGAEVPVAAVGCHAADEAYFAWSQDGALFVRGKGALLGLGDEDAFADTWVPVPVFTNTTAEASAVPRQISWIRGITQIWAKLRIGDDNKFVVTGDNYFGQLAVGDENTRSVFVEPQWPSQIASVVDVQPGFRHTILLAVEGTTSTE